MVGKGPAPPIAFPPWIEPVFERQFAPRKRFSEISEWPSSAHPHHPWSYGKLVRFIPPVMEGQDAMFSGRPVEARAPFLDRRLIRFLLRLPPIPWYMEKELLRRAQQGVLPDKIRLHPKMPLQYDPLQLHIVAGKWSPRVPDGCQAGLQNIVDWPRVSQLLTNATGNELYVHLRPVLLALWLNAVEKSAVIQ
jgi:asparagine synthase (glutamine-hydrolysing)